MKECEMIRAQLIALGLYNENTYISERDGKYNIITSGRFSREYSKLGRPVKASNDDMAMMFGHIIPCVDEPRHRGAVSACIIRDRGFSVSARSAGELIAACILLEKMCKTELLAHMIGQVRHLDPLLCMIEHTVYVRKYSRTSLKGGADRTAAPPEAVPDQELRGEIIRYGKLLVENRLIQSTWGNISARIDENRFLITPSGVDYDLIRPEEIVEINIDDGSYAEGLHPSSEKKLHRLIYAERPDIKAIIHTHSSNCQVFAACHRGLAGLTEEKTALIYPCSKYSVSGSEKLAENVAAVIADHDGCIMANHGSVSGADTLEHALAQAIEAERIAGVKLGL